MVTIHTYIQTSEAVDNPNMPQRSELKYLLYKVLSKPCTYALPPTFLMFIMKTNCPFSLFRGCDTVCADVRGNNKSTLSYVTQHKVQICYSKYNNFVFNF